jgi:hypothetical protein
MNALDVMSRIKELQRLLNRGESKLSQEDRDYIAVHGAANLVKEEDNLRKMLRNTECLAADRISVVKEFYEMLCQKLGLGVTWMGNRLAVRWVSQDKSIKRDIQDLVQINLIITWVELPRDDEEEVPK